MTGSRKYNFKCQSFPNTIEQERRRRGWTVTKLAELSGVSRYSIAAYETWAAGGIVPKQQMKSVTDTTAQMIADALRLRRNSFSSTMRRRRQSINRALSLFQQERSGTAQY